MGTKVRYKNISELAVGNIFVWSDYGRRYFFKVTKIEDCASNQKLVKAVFVWGNGDGAYMGQASGFKESFCFQNDYVFMVLKTDRHSKCPNCFGNLE